MCLMLVLLMCLLSMCLHVYVCMLFMPWCVCVPLFKFYKVGVIAIRALAHSMALKHNHQQPIHSYAKCHFMWLCCLMSRQSSSISFFFYVCLLQCEFEKYTFKKIHKYRHESHFKYTFKRIAPNWKSFIAKSNFRTNRIIQRELLNCLFNLVFPQIASFTHVPFYSF